MFKACGDSETISLWRCKKALKPKILSVIMKFNRDSGSRAEGKGFFLAIFLSDRKTSFFLARALLSAKKRYL